MFLCYFIRSHLIFIKFSILNGLVDLVDWLFGFWLIFLIFMILCLFLFLLFFNLLFLRVIIDNKAECLVDINEGLFEQFLIFPFEPITLFLFFYWIVFHCHVVSGVLCTMQLRVCMSSNKYGLLCVFTLRIVFYQLWRYHLFFQICFESLFNLIWIFKYL